MASGKASKKKRAQAPVQAPMRRKDSRSADRRLWVAAAVAAVLVLAAVAATLLTRGEEGGGAAAGATLPEASEIASLFRGIPQTGTTLGRPDAPVTLVEFLDMQCPFCRQFETEVVPRRSRATASAAGGCGSRPADWHSSGPTRSAACARCSRPGCRGASTS